MSAAGERARALIGLRLLLWRRRFLHGRGVGRLALLALGAVMAGLVSLSLSAVPLEGAALLARLPARLAAEGGARSFFASLLVLILALRIWLALVGLASQPQAFLDPRRFRTWPVSTRLISLLNFAAQLFDPLWLFAYPPLVACALGASRLPGAPGLPALLGVEVLLVLFTAGALHLAGAGLALLDARPALRRTAAVAMLFASWGVFVLFSTRGTGGHELRSAAPHLAPWAWLRWTPPGWAARAAFDGGPWGALLAAGLALGAIACAAAAHALSSRELSRAPETVRARGTGAGWRLPLAPEVFSALFEKEAKTALRTGWLQLVLVPVSFALLRFSGNPGVSGSRPLLAVAGFAHLSVLELLTNAYGRDLGGARAWFLWPVPLRAVLAAKNAVAYAFSLAVFLLLAAITFPGLHPGAGQVAGSVLVHAATFLLAATFGNFVSALAPVPLRGKTRRVAGVGPVGLRFLAMALLGAGTVAPWLLARVSGLPEVAFAAGQLVVVGIAWIALLGAAAHYAIARRLELVSALLKDE